MLSLSPDRLTDDQTDTAVAPFPVGAKILFAPRKISEFWAYIGRFLHTVLVREGREKPLRSGIK